MNDLQNEIKDDNLIYRKSYHLLLLLIFAGVIPFFFSAILLRTNWFSQTTVFEFLFSYAALILTFLGGIQWGVGVMRLDGRARIFPHLFTLSVLPSLVAWLLLLLHYPKLQVIGFILSFTMVLAADVVLTLKKIIPRWFLLLRLVITLLVVTMLLFCYSALHAANSNVQLNDHSVKGRL